MSVCSEPTPTSHEPCAAGPAGSAPARPHVTDPFLDVEPPSGDNARVLRTLAAAVGAGTLLIAVGLVLSRVGGGGPKQAAPMTTTLSEQHKMMREAVQVAKDATDVQRERLELMRREMERGERVGSADGAARAEGEFVGD